ncbi:RNA polymerase sigma factor [Pseudoroseomonas sp. WGS1072]|uniref:RNA polymerase sigma factor n=1 Tax=Roseomonas sp. WGS1072 TaxID=3366816 RepID=UPI003BF0F393
MGDREGLSLLRHLSEGYEDLLGRLSRRLGSASRASEALQETCLRVGRAVALPEVRDPEAFLLRIAANAAADQSRQEARRRLEPLEIEALLAVSDDAPTPEAIVQGREEMRHLQRALEALPARRRAILEAARLQGLPHEAIARRFGVSVRTVAYEIERALDHCSVWMERKPS